ncbi:MAG: hypothetical protein J6V26_00070 [Alistipes sp.]|nr:hypothetical protein [Alistipes sp.]
MMRMHYLVALMALGLVSCGGNATQHEAECETALVESESVNYDSLYRAMDVRYNQLCVERVEALAERDSARRARLLEANDMACKSFSDSLQRIMAMQGRL